MTNNGENNWKREESERNLEQVSGGGETELYTALYRCPVCNREQRRTSLKILPAECACPCGATMVRVSRTQTIVQ